MANQHKHKVRGLRSIDDELWEAFKKATAHAGIDRSAAVKAFIEWYIQRAGAELPPRSPAGPVG